MELSEYEWGRTMLMAAVDDVTDVVLDPSIDWGRRERALFMFVLAGEAALIEPDQEKLIAEFEMQLLPKVLALPNEERVAVARLLMETMQRMKAAEAASGRDWGLT